MSFSHYLKKVETLQFCQILVSCSFVQLAKQKLFSTKFVTSRFAEFIEKQLIPTRAPNKTTEIR
jgi:hypothetical protein